MILVNSLKLFYNVLSVVNTPCTVYVFLFRRNAINSINQTSVIISLFLKNIHIDIITLVYNK